MWRYVYCYLTQLCYSGDGGFACVFSVHGILFEEQEDFVVLWVIALRDEVDADKPGIWQTYTTEILVIIHDFCYCFSP